MKKSINKAEVFTIDTDENRCALIFSFQLQEKLNIEKKVFITANNYEFVYQNLSRIKPYIPFFDKIHDNTKYLFLKDSFINLFDQYGNRSITNELNRVLQQNEFDFFYFHRVDLFFSNLSESELEEVLLSVINDARYFHKRVIFSYNAKSIRGAIVENILKSKRDILYTIYEDKNSSDNDCYSTVKWYNEFIEKDYYMILLLSEDKKLLDFHKNLFSGRSGIKYSHSTMEELLKDRNILNNNIDLIIYDDQISPIDRRVVNFIKNYSHFSQIYLFSRNRFLRRGDLDFVESIGVDEIISYNFDILDYISSIENTLNTPFYSKNFQHIKDLNITKVVNEDRFSKYIKLLLDKKIIFSLLSIPRKLISKDIDIQKKIRDYDTTYYYEKDKLIFFVLVNICSHDAVKILSKRFDVKKREIVDHTKHYKKRRV